MTFSFTSTILSPDTARQFLDLLNCFNLHVLNAVLPTHQNNNILDLILVRTDELTALNQLSQITLLCIATCLSANPKIVSTTRKLHNINLQSFVQDISSFTLFNSPPSNLTEPCDQCNSDLSAILDKHAPLRAKIITIWPKVPWYNDYIREQKRICCRLERSWRHSHTKTDHPAFIHQCTVVKQSIYTSKMNYHSDLINEAGVDRKALFRNVDRLLHTRPEKFFSIVLVSCSISKQFR